VFLSTLLETVCIVVAFPGVGVRALVILDPLRIPNFSVVRPWLSIFKSNADKPRLSDLWQLNILKIKGDFRIEFSTMHIEIFLDFYLLNTGRKLISAPLGRLSDLESTVTLVSEGVKLCDIRIWSKIHVERLWSLLLICLVDNLDWELNAVTLPDLEWACMLDETPQHVLHSECL